MTEAKPTTTQGTPTEVKPRSRREGGARGGRRGGDRAPRGEKKAAREFEQKTIMIRRVTRVVAGGRRFNFSVAMVIGNGQGSVGVGIGKAGDTAAAIQKAFNDARKNLITVKRTDSGSIPHEVAAKYSAARVMIMPNKGRGIVAGSSLRSVLQLGGIKDVTGKVWSKTKNALTIARATVKALEPFRTTYVPVARKETAHVASASIIEEEVVS